MSVLCSLNVVNSFPNTECVWEGSHNSKERWWSGEAKASCILEQQIKAACLKVWRGLWREEEELQFRGYKTQLTCFCSGAHWRHCRYCLVETSNFHKTSQPSLIPMNSDKRDLWSWLSKLKQYKLSRHQQRLWKHSIFIFFPILFLAFQYSEHLGRAADHCAWGNPVRKVFMPNNCPCRARLVWASYSSGKMCPCFNTVTTKQALGGISVGSQHSQLTSHFPKALIPLKSNRWCSILQIIGNKNWWDFLKNWSHTSTRTYCAPKITGGPAVFNFWYLWILSK